MTDIGSIDLSQDAAGRATAFATGCAATWVFVRNLVMRPAIKSCHAQIADLRERIADMKATDAHKDIRISQLETILLTEGPARMREAMQKAISETRIEIDRMGGKS